VGTRHGTIERREQKPKWILHFVQASARRN
jgi:hypothetical protein